MATSSWHHGSYNSGGVGSSYHSTSTYRPFTDSGNNDVEPIAPPLLNDPSFDILEWHPAYQSCQRYFLDHAQHEPATQALCALINIRLPFQALENPIHSSAPPQPPAGGFGSSSYQFNPFPRAGNSNVNSPNRSRSGGNQTPPTFVSLVPYVRRLVVTAFDKPPILHGFFGDDYVRGVLPHVDCERRNYLFAAKHGGWRTCKKQYDDGSGGGRDESVPFLKPLDEAKVEELTAAEKSWSAWLAMEDWMVGPRAPEDRTSGGSSGDHGQGQDQGHGQAGFGARNNDDNTNPLPDGLPDQG
ncbi:hypothetical protein LTR36_004990 [Oleoguttula mirabilis]|uniref:Uncharacterized protein n=1 Tax=Oleoguttula mirabilis TaxID=1507867 RepID=A0AAV9JVD2_9PEZI|nr:hypothetical protein LTR36_004990 [Oleoguttula mirabilis]